MGKERISYKSLIKARLMSGGTITPIEALRDFGCYRLQARISELKAEGMNILTTYEESISRVTGRTIRYARYILNPNNKGAKTTPQSN